MKIKVLIFLGIFIFVCNMAQAMESKEQLTRISISASDAVKYETRWLDNPPRLIVKFNTSNVQGRLVEDTALNQGVVKNVTVSYYPDSSPDSDRRQIKFLTFWLSQKTDYNVWSKDNKIFVDFKNPALDSKSRRIEISGVASAIDPASKAGAADALLAGLNKIYDAPTSNAVQANANKNMDIRWVFAVLLIGVYILWFRPKEWKGLMDRIAEGQKAAKPGSNGSEHRKWWRHNLLPLKNNNIYIKLESPESRTELGLVPSDIGYGGLSFECNRLKRLKGKLNLSIFMPGAISPVEVEGNVAWQRNSRNLLRRRVGVSFIRPPEKDWARIHHYIEEQYAALKQ